MPSQSTRALRDRRKDALLAAARRWAERASERDTSAKLIAQYGAGAADSEERRSAFFNREAMRLERTIGTWDATVAAPNEEASHAALPVARIVTMPDDAGVEPEGIATGFLVSNQLLLTNHHVFPDAAAAEGMAANFMYIRTSRGVQRGTYFLLEPKRFFRSDQDLDFALVAVQAVNAHGDKLASYGSIRLIGSSGKILKGQPVNIIQHPEGGVRQYAVKANRLLDIMETGFLHYETDTLPGSSGSPAFNNHWELVALHHSGVPKVRNGQIMTKHGTAYNPDRDSDEDIDWVANEGIRVSALVQRLKSMAAKDGKDDMLDDLIRHSADPLAGRPSRRAVTELAAHVGSGVSGELSAASSTVEAGSTAAVSRALGTENVFNFQGPVTINLYQAGRNAAAGFQTAAVGSSESAGPLADALLEKKQNFDRNYSKRPGYNPKFLPVQIPLPTVKPQRVSQLYSVQDYRRFSASSGSVPPVSTANLKPTDPFELKYHHYSIVTNKAYRMAMFTAENVDYTEDARQDGRSRAAFGGENWTLDPRVPNAYQLVNEEVYRPARNIDCGHLVRREDNCWGEPGLETEYANADTYHWTNCTPQHELFNQEHPAGYANQKGIWGAFERHMQEQSEINGGKFVVFSGPVLVDDEGEVYTFQRGDVFIPHKFWKVVAIMEEKGLSAYGLIMDQSNAIKRYGLDVSERVNMSPFSQQQVPLSKITSLTDIVFPAVLVKADRYSARNTSSTSKRGLESTADPAHGSVDDPDDVPMEAAAAAPLSEAQPTKRSKKADV